ncbi:hypothetical protein DEHRE_09380 [Dehalobacter restrictus DSM 9455]|uniref:Uncharacterized protein n=1 Tax=Dehalobacter restrictus (strain DSM 9455 / PER-K23) TaxID=871738 RepID=A0ABN4BVG9_DEHRP|nr:hypothetical protein DEHRE_09380 [Dehalobacter restrictus DSM 9455]
MPEIKKQAAINLNSLFKRKNLHPKRIPFKRIISNCTKTYTTRSFSPFRATKKALIGFILLVGATRLERAASTTPR